MKNFPVFLLILSLVLFSCGNDTNDFEIVPRDKTITVANSVNEMFFDSTQMEAFISKEALTDSLADRIRSFYNSRNFQLAWFDSTGLAEYAHSFLSAQNDYIGYSKDSSLNNPFIKNLQDSLTADSNAYKINNTERLKTELQLTEAFLRYALRAYQGSNAINAQDLGWFIPRKKVDLTGFLDSLIKNKGKDLSAYEPVNRQYNLLRQALLKYYDIDKKGAWDTIAINKATFKVGDSSSTIAAVRKHLMLIGDLLNNDRSSVYDTSLRSAVKHFQRRYGLKEDGLVNTSLIKELNRPIELRIRQLLINMERLRWVPAELPKDYLLVNIPAYKLFVYEDGKLDWTMNVVVGAVAHSTVIFRGDMKYIVFSPYWNIPPSIIKNEVVPGMKRNPNYLASHNMEWNNGNVRQKPGPGNSLGQVKFLFPNNYNIYLHDTPSKSLFGETNRAFSHGCIRLSEPKKMATYLLRKDSTWTNEKITKAMNDKKEKYVTLNPTIPVFIGYFTAWVDSEGNLNFRDDIYGHDKKLAEKMFANP